MPPPKYCIECGHALPSVRTPSTICAKCKTPLATWWDENSQTYRTNRESILPDLGTDAMGLGAGGMMSGWTEEEKRDMMKRRNGGTIEERGFNGALGTLEGYFERPNNYLSKTMAETKKMISRTLDLSLNRPGVRETLAKNVDVWMHLGNIFNTAIPHLEKRSLQMGGVDGELGGGHDVSESAELILKHYDVLREDLHFLNSLLVISRNMLAIKDTAQELCARVGFDKQVHKLIVLCVNVTSKGYDGETVDELRRGKLNDITELYKKLLVTCLQHTHNWTMGNDRFKMNFWFEMLFDEEIKNDTVNDMPADDLDVDIVHQEVSNWLRRNNKKDPLAAKLLEKYEEEWEMAPKFTPGKLPDEEVYEDELFDEDFDEPAGPVWKADIADKFEQDRVYWRVSHELDSWWKKVRDANFDGWVVPMETVEDAKARAKLCKETAMQRYIPQRHSNRYEPTEELYEQSHDGEHDELDDGQSNQEDNGEDEEDDDDSYAEGPLRGLLTEIPNILDTKQIEALHMTVKACIVDSMGSGLTPAGENLQKTRCKLFLALECGKNLLRELLVFIAVWEQTDQQFIFQITAQIIESFHHNALLPYAWNSLRILKDIVSPAQTVLLRLINYMFRARKDSPIYSDVKDYQRDAKLIHFLYNYFRCRVVPDCLALISAQAQIRKNEKHPADFPVDLWDMERAKDGLSQYLDFISVIAEITEMRGLLIDWDTTYELVALLKALEAGVARKSLDDRSPSRRSPHDDQPMPHSANVPPLHDTPHKFAWAGIKNQVLIILTSLIAPSNARRNGPGNPAVQKQLMDHEGVMPLLNCCVYDGHNEYLKERATLAIKFLMEGCKEAQDFVKELVPVKQQQVQEQARAKANADAQAANGKNGPRVAGSGRATPSLTQMKDDILKSGELGAGVTAGLKEKDLDLDRKMRELKLNMQMVSQAREASGDRVGEGSVGSGNKK